MQIVAGIGRLDKTGLQRNNFVELLYKFKAK
jgi:hypothetical protein